MRKSALVSVFTVLLCSALGAEVKIDSSTFGAIEARPIGPAVTGGRIAAIDGVASDPRIIYVGAAGGGVWKTTNAGISFKPVFDKNPQAIGAIANPASKRGPRGLALNSAANILLTATIWIFSARKPDWQLSWMASVTVTRIDKRRMQNARLFWSRVA